MIEIHGINSSITYRINEKVLERTRIPNDPYEQESVNQDDLVLEEVVISPDGEAVVVLDKFDTADGYGDILLTGNSGGDFQWWSPYATFYRPRR